MRKPSTGFFLTAFVWSIGFQTFLLPAEGISDPIVAETVAALRASIPQIMRDNKVPGLAVALVDDKAVLWTEGFGYTDDDQKVRVTPDTFFSIQSMSKTFTATAVMMAVRDGLVDLDTPITVYLPDFHVNSRFEKEPEKKITLRHLLSHRAGFTHEAPVGNNYDPDSSSFEEHIRSISDTWLLFPVGGGYKYSNLGIDLAGYLLQEVSGKPFAAYVREKLLDPLGMKGSSFDMNEIRRYSNRAIGHDLLARVPLEIPMIPAGGFYTNASELSRFVQFHMNGGVVGGARIIDEAILKTMYEIPFREKGHPSGYALGIEKAEKRGTYYLNHGGGGFGFLTYMAWYPEYKLGAIVLTNSTQTRVWPGEIAHRALDRILEKRIPATSATNDLKGLSAYAGKYRIRVRGVPLELIKVARAGDNLVLTRASEDFPLVQHQPGLFFAPDGEALDFRSSPATYRGLKLERIGEPVWLMALVVCCGVLAVGINVLRPGYGLLRRLFARGAARPSEQLAGRRWPARVTAVIQGAGSLVIFLLIWYLGIRFPLFTDGPYPWGERLPFPLSSIPLVPAVSAVVSVILVLCAGLWWTKGYGSRLSRVVYSLTALASAVTTMVFWRWLR